MLFFKVKFFMVIFEVELKELILWFESENKLFLLLVFVLNKFEKNEFVLGLIFIVFVF